MGQYFQALTKLVPHPSIAKWMLSTPSASVELLSPLETETAPVEVTHTLCTEEHMVTSLSSPFRSQQQSPQLPTPSFLNLPPSFTILCLRSLPSLASWKSIFFNFLSFLSQTPCFHVSSILRPLNMENLVLSSPSINTSSHSVILSGCGL